MNIVKPKRRVNGALVFIDRYFKRWLTLRRRGINIPAV
jgi:hypothetical protein